MKPEDWSQLDLSIPEIVRETGPIGSVVVLSPTGGEIERWQAAYPRASVTGWHIRDWDIREPCPRRFDLMVAADTFLCAADPDLWFRNCFAACRWLVVLDLCRGFRGGGGRELPVGFDADPVTPDCMRYSCPPEMVALLSTAYDLNVHRDRMRHLATYPIGSNGINFVALWKGDA